MSLEIVKSTHVVFDLYAVNIISENMGGEMPHLCTWEENGLYRKFFGVVDGEEILQSNFKSHENPEFRTNTYVINDFSDVSQFEVSDSYSKVLALTDNITSRSKGKFKIALYSSNEEHSSYAETYCSLMANKLFECEIFTSLSEARKWVE